MSLNYQYPQAIVERSDWDTISQQTFKVCMALMVLAMDIEKPTPQEDIELKRRIKVYEGLFGLLMNSENGTFNLIKNHYGIKTNVSTMTATQWDKHMRACFVREENYQLRKEEAKA